MVEIRYRYIRKEDIPEIFDWFDDELFYFGSKRPAWIPKQKLENSLLDDSQRSYVFVNNPDKLIGLAQIQVDLEKSFGWIEFRFLENNEKTAVLNNFANHMLFEYRLKKIFTRVFDFDNKKKELCQESGFLLEATLREQIFKNARYYNLLIYGYGYR